MAFEYRREVALVREAHCFRYLQQAENARPQESLGTLDSPARYESVNALAQSDFRLYGKRNVQSDDQRTAGRVDIVHVCHFGKREPH